MFKWLNKQGVESSKGFVVQSVARFIIEYREGKKSISIEVESDYAPNKRPYEIVSKNSFLYWNDGSVIDPKKQQEIIQNFRDAMEFQGIGVILEDK